MADKTSDTVEVSGRSARRGRQLSLAGLLQDKTVQGVFWQIFVVGLVLAVGGYLYLNTIENISNRDIRTGYDFLEREAGFEIGEKLIAYTPAASFGHALIVGLLNTLHVCVIGLLLSTVLGIFVGISSLSQNFLLAKLTAGYIHFLRNIPVLLQIILWYSILISDRFLPHPRLAEPILGVLFTQRGVYFPVFEWHVGWAAAIFALCIAILFVFAVFRLAREHQNATGERRQVWPWTLLLLVGLPFAAWVMFGAPTKVSIPALDGFNIAGGGRITPEFVAVLFGLTVYTSAFIGEIVRAGILSVAKGQIEAARALGLPESVVLWKIVLPQALRVIIPPLTSQYLNLIKNSSLAVAVGYPDLVNVANTTINVTGQAIEGVSIIMIIYLLLSIATALFMNWYNAQVRLVER